MEHTLTVHSQILVQPSKAHAIFTKLLLVSVGFLLLSALISFFTASFRTSALFSCAVAVMVFSHYKSDHAPHFEPALAHLSFEPDALHICYENSSCGDISILYRDLTTVEHSDRMHCFRLAFSGKVKGTINGDYHLLYMEDGSAPTFVQMLAKHMQVPVQSVD